jgi:hypothetical protein
VSTPDKTNAVKLPHRTAAFFTKIIGKAETQILADGRLMFTTYFLDETGVIHIVQVEWPKDVDARNRVATILRAFGIKYNAIAAVTASECWTLPPDLIDASGEMRDPSYGSYAAHPARIEGVICALTYRVGGRLYTAKSRREIVRGLPKEGHTEGTVTALSPMADDMMLGAPVTSGSRLDKLLSAEPVNAELRAEADAWLKGAVFGAHVREVFTWE